MVYNGKPYQNGMIWGYQFRKHPYHVLTCMDQAGFIVILPMPNLIEAVIIIPATSTGLEPANIKKKCNPTSASLQLSTKKSRYHQSVNELESPHPKRKPSSKKKQHPPNFLIHKISSMVFGNLSILRRLRSSSLQRLYTRCCGCRLRKNLCTSAMGFRN